MASSAPSIPTLEPPTMIERLRKRASGKFFNKNTSPKFKRHARDVRQRCIVDSDIGTAIVDMEPADSQEAYAFADMIVASPQV